MCLIARWYKKEFWSYLKVTFFLEKILFTVSLTYQSLPANSDLHDVFEVCVYLCFFGWLTEAEGWIALQEF